MNLSLKEELRQAYRDVAEQVISDRLEMKMCRRKFSQCLDCTIHNKCQRYHDHRKEVT